MGKKKKNIKEIKSMCRKKGFIFHPNNIYTDIKARYDLICTKCGEIQSKSLEAVGKGENSCDFCGVYGKSKDELNHILANSSIRCVDDKEIYYNDNDYKFECTKCGKKFETTINYFYSKFSSFKTVNDPWLCENCKHIHNLNRYRKILLNLDLELLTKEWPEMDDDGRIILEFACIKCGTIYSRRIDNILKGQRCKASGCENNLVGQQL
jgi:hypothetical protein